MSRVGKLALVLGVLALLVVLHTSPASADVTETFYVDGTFTNLSGQTETLSPTSTISVDITSGIITGGDLSVAGATFTGTPVDVANSYTWAYGTILDPHALLLDVPPLFSNNLVGFTGGDAIGVLTLPSFGISGSDSLTLSLPPTPEPASMILFGTGLLAMGGLFFWRVRSRA